MMMPEDITRIAGHVHAARPGWDVAGIEAFLHRVNALHDPSPERALTVALRVAADADAHKPIALTFARYWTTPGQPVRVDRGSCAVHGGTLWRVDRQFEGWACCWNDRHNPSSAPVRPGRDVTTQATRCRDAVKETSR